MKTLILVALWFVSIPLCNSQSITQNIISDSALARHSSDLAWQLKDINPDSSLYHAKIALNYARKSRQKKIEAYSLSDIGNYYKRKELYGQALDAYIQSLNIRKKIGDPELIAGAYNQIAILHKQKEDYNTAAKNFQLGLECLIDNKNSKERLKLLNGYSMTIYHLGNYKESLLYIDSAFQLAEKIGDSLSLARLFQNQGAIYQYLDQPKLALKAYRKAEEYYEELQDFSGIIDIQINLAAVYVQDGNLVKAEDLLLKAEKKSVEHQLNSNLPIIYFDLAKLYQDINWSKSQYYFELVYENAKRIGKTTLIVESGIELCRIGLLEKSLKILPQVIQELELHVNQINKLDVLIDYYEVTSRYWKMEGDFKKAYLLNEKVLSLKDSLYNDLNESKDLSTLLELSRQEQKTVKEELKRKSAEKQHSELQNRFHKAMNWSLVIVIVILLIFLILVWRGARRKTQLNLLKLENLRQEQEFHIQTNQLIFNAELKFLEESLHIEKEVRKSIGKDLHDHLASKLAVVQIRLDAFADLEERDSSKHKELNSIIDLVEESCNDTRMIAHDLIEQKRLNETLSELLSNHCKNISRSGKLFIEYTVIGEPYDVDLAIKKNLLATVVLLINNIIRHANANAASLQLFYHSDSLNLVLDDNGIGFNQEKINESKGVGLTNAKERILEIAGEIDIATRMNEGTTISISIPTMFENV